MKPLIKYKFNDYQLLRIIAQQNNKNLRLQREGDEVVRIFKQQLKYN